MLCWEARMDIKDLHKQGHSIHGVARLTGHARNTVRRILRPPNLTPRQKCGRKSLLEPFKEHLRERATASGLSAVRLCEELRQLGYTGSIHAVRRYLQQIEKPHQALEKATVRFETPPGEQAQVDWAECGSYLDENNIKRKVYAFVMVLGFSRMVYVEFTLRMHLPELIACHERAFEYFGGFPRRILYDNMKQVRLSLSEWNPLMQDFLSHYAIVPVTCRPYRPRTKGKVERSIRYLKDNFLKGREFADLADLKARGQHWQTEVANVRIHATTKARPVDLLAAEKLTPCRTVAEYQLSRRHERTVDAEGFVRLKGCRYSVPPTAVGRKVIVEQGEQKVIVRLGDCVIAEHRPATRVGDCIADPTHIAAMWQLAMARTSPPAPSSRLLFQQTVAVRPLSIYEEAAQ